jgi:putative ABC transport system substrate-binding protein
MATDIRRREFIVTVGGAAAWPLAPHTQQAVMPMIGFLSAEWPHQFADRLRAFRDGLQETGYIEAGT